MADPIRRDLGILQRTREIFFASRDENLRPWAGKGLDIHASTGPVGIEASEWWGSSQAALSVAIWSKTSDVHTYDERYNIPLHLLADPRQSWLMPAGFEPILLHYHYLAEPQHQEQFREALDRIGCSSEIAGWTGARMGLFSEEGDA